ncbi:hypothetical protein CCOS865_05185 [Pseudomonas reidholzensis]|uniref:Uncharacterized protein n=1 Tax=Pseudomonas reidholzensis TaxID=1785162 RepID=A0A383S2G3_9PSED|nr:hypothetical protein CCOS865_05185 [Pseudomonas reidholzensis]
MLKIVPDPPHSPHSLEDTILQATESALCAQTVAHQALLLQPKSPVSVLIMAAMHELEALRMLLESALIHVQPPPSRGRCTKTRVMCRLYGPFRGQARSYRGSAVIGMTRGL